jgi:poly(3-hydroxybutyrate) depolymerase
VQTVATWAEKNGCSPALVDTGTRIHVSEDGQGLETKISRHDGCAKNGAAELWTVDGGGHLFVFTPDSLERIWQFMQAHAKE